MNNVGSKTSFNLVFINYCNNLIVFSRALRVLVTQEMQNFMGEGNEPLRSIGTPFQNRCLFWPQSQHPALCALVAEAGTMLDLSTKIIMVLIAVLTKDI